MKAITLTSAEGIKFQDVTQPLKAEPGHLLIKMDSCAINPGDKAFINRALPIGAATSLYNIYGASGAGIVTEIGKNVPESYAGKKVAIYRSLKSSSSLVGAWCEYSHLPILDCILLPENAILENYSSSLVNAITAYAFLNQTIEKGHKAIIATAGSSATGIALLGFCLTYNFPIISIVRNNESKKELENLGAKNILVQTDSAFKAELQSLSHELSATAIFDGVGGIILNQIIDAVPNQTTIYTYGYLGGIQPLSIHTSLLNVKGLTITGFSNGKSKTAQDPDLLTKALNEITNVIHMPHFRTKVGKKFPLHEIEDALLYVSQKGEKAVLSLL